MKPTPWPYNARRWWHHEWPAVVTCVLLLALGLFGVLL